MAATSFFGGEFFGSEFFTAVSDVVNVFGDAFRGHRRYPDKARVFGRRPPYCWEVAREELRNLTLPTDRKSAEVACTVIRRFNDLLTQLDADDIAFKRALAVVDSLIATVAKRLESLRLAQLLEETKQRIWAEIDAEYLRAEESEINDLMEFL